MARTFLGRNYRIIMRHIDLLLVLGIALALRLGLAWASPGASYDMESYHLQAQAVLSGQNVYQVTFRYPYPPLWQVWPAAAQRLADATTWPFHFWIKLPSIIADLIIGWLLYTWPRSIHSVSAAQRAALYLFNPIVLLISAAHGQFDALVILGVLLAVRWSIGQHVVRSALSLGFAIALKTFPALLVPVFVIGLLSWQQAALFTVLAASVIGVFVLPYWSASGARLSQIMFNYNSTADHSYAYILDKLTVEGVAVAKPVLAALRPLSRWLLAGAALGVTLRSMVRRWPLEQRVALMFAAIYVVTPGLASQQMLWLTPFLILTAPRWPVWLYTIISTAALTVFYAQNFPGVIFLPAAWSGNVLLVSRFILAAVWWLTAVCILVYLGRAQLASAVDEA